MARLEHCSSLWYSLGPCETRSLEKRRQCDNHKFGTVTSDQEIVQCKAVKRPGSAFSILDLTCHGHLHLYRVRHQPPCSFSFAYLGHPSHANRTDATVEVVVARFQNYPKLFFQSVPYIGPIWDQISTAKEALQELQVWDSYQGPWSKTLRWTKSLQCKTVKLRSCKYHWVATSLSKYLQLCVLLASLFWLLLAVSQSPVFWLLIWLSMANGSFLKFNANTSPHAVQW